MPRRVFLTTPLYTLSFNTPILVQITDSRPWAYLGVVFRVQTTQKRIRSCYESL